MTSLVINENVIQLLHYLFSCFQITIFSVINEIFDANEILPRSWKNVGHAVPVKKAQLY